MADQPVITAERCPLFITGDTAVAAELRKLATAAGVSARLVSDVAQARAHWHTAGSVVIGPDLAEACAQAGFPPRPAVVVLTGERLALDHAWSLAMALGADQVAGLPAAGPWLA
ncbi:MAG: hypothetical protein ACRD0P_39795, partial [Stackebrandtia sp.]